MQLAKDRRIPYYFVAFFIGLAIVDGIMVTLAVRSHSGIVIEHPYEHGLAYNKTIKAAKDQQALGWRTSLDFVQHKAQQGKVVFLVSDGQGQAIKASNVRVRFTRPTQADFDFEVPLHRIAERYSAIVDFPLQGLWEMRVYADAKGITYQQSKRVVVE